MPQWPLVTIGIITFDRTEEIQRTVRALLDVDLDYPEDRLRWIIADDSSPKGYVTKLKRLSEFKHIKPQFISTEQNAGWGANANHLLAHVETDYLFMIEDDYVLAQPLDLRPGVALMEAKPDVGMLRYRGTAGDHVVFHQFEVDVSAYLPDFRHGLGLPGKLSYLQLDSGSPSLYLYSNGPHLKHRRFHQQYGDYPVGLRLGETEETYAHTVKDGMTMPGAPAIAILPEWVAMWWDHIGKTYQHTEADK